MENALEWVITALGHYHTLEKTQENESALQCLRNAIELLQKEEHLPKGFELTCNEWSALSAAIVHRHADLQKYLEQVKDGGFAGQYAEAIGAWEQELEVLDGLRRKAISIPIAGQR